MSSAFSRYFTRSIDYPKLSESVELLPLNVLWNYVSNAFLDGVVNMCSSQPPLRAYLMGRYLDEDNRVYGDTDDGFGQVPLHQEPPGSHTWVPIDIRLTKKQLFELLTQPQRLSNSRFGMFGDDMVLLFGSTLADGRRCYWYFWYDCDVSDCSIGRFVTSDTEEQVIAAFEEHVKQDTKSYCHAPWPVPSAFFLGWMSF